MSKPWRQWARKREILKLPSYAVPGTVVQAWGRRYEMQGHEFMDEDGEVLVKPAGWRRLA